MRIRSMAIFGALFLLACADDERPPQGTEPGTSTTSSTGAEESTSSSSSSSSSSTAVADSSESGSASSSSGTTTGGPQGPPQDEDFEWDAIEPFDCGPNGHVILASGSPSNRVNLIFLGDGYVAGEIATTYVDHVDALLDAMFGPDGVPNDIYAASVNICRIDVVSNESGIDFPDVGIEVDTALDGTGSEATRLAFVNVAIVNTILDEALAGSTVSADWVAVTVNTERWVAAGGYPMIWPGAQPFHEIGVHEAGHTFHALADEYSVPGGTYDGLEPVEMNVTADARSDKWEVWLGYDQPGVGEIGFYEGGRYFDFGIWRPSENGRMRSVEQPHNAPSVDKMIRDIYEIARPIDDFSPKVEGEFPPALGVRLVDETLLVVDWEVDGQVVLSDAGPRIWTSELDLAAGSHQVSAFAHDPTDLVRASDRSALEMRVTWPVMVPPNLQPTTTLAIGGSSPPTRAQLELRSPPPRPTSAGPLGVPHPLGGKTQASLQSNALLLLARDQLLDGEIDKARGTLREHRDRFGASLRTDRDTLVRALGCASGQPSSDAAFAGLRTHGRFGRVLRQLCN